MAQELEGLPILLRRDRIEPLKQRLCRTTKIAQILFVDGRAAVLSRFGFGEDGAHDIGVVLYKSQR